MQENSKSGPGTVSFGYAEIDAEEKAPRVRQVFDAVASRYDLMNDLMSAGVHRAWKGALVNWLAPRPGLKLVDVAGGTGDVARAVLRRAAKVGRSRSSAPGEAVICDINAAMLEAGKARPASAEGTLHWVCGDAEALPLPDASADAYTIAFGIRNVTRRAAALAEARRVLKPGGRFLCLEFSAPAVPGLDALYDAYSFHVIPALGGLVAGDREAYQYLVESIRRFPDQAAFAQEIAGAGLAQVRFRNLSGGIAALHSAWRL